MRDERINVDIAALIRRKRKEANLTQGGLAARLQLLGYDSSRSDISHIEERWRRPRAGDILMLSYVLDITPDEWEGILRAHLQKLNTP